MIVRLKPWISSEDEARKCRTSEVVQGARFVQLCHNLHSADTFKQQCNDKAESVHNEQVKKDKCLTERVRVAWSVGMCPRGLIMSSHIHLLLKRQAHFI